MRSVLGKPSLTWLGTLGGNESVAEGVSANGTVVVGVSRDKSGQMRAFRWVKGSGMENLGTLGWAKSWARGVTADGRVVVGVLLDEENRKSRAFRWTQGGKIQDLGVAGEARDVSADGNVIVGTALVTPFRWVSGRIELLDIAGGTPCLVSAVSDDGTTIVGQVLKSNWVPFRWTQREGVKLLSTEGGVGAGANDTSADGLIVVGSIDRSDRQLRIRAARWIADSIVQDLGTLGGDYADALAVSASGDVVVGMSSDSGGRLRAFRWTKGRGMEDLSRTYAALLADGSQLDVATSISPNGRYIAGNGYNARTGRKEAFLLDVGDR